MEDSKPQILAPQVSLMQAVASRVLSNKPTLPCEGVNVGVYGIVNTRNGLIYVGSSTDIKARTGAHVYTLRSNSHHNSGLQADWLEFGEEAFVFVLLEDAAAGGRDLFLREQAWVDRLNALSLGYNRTAVAIRDSHCTDSLGMRVADSEQSPMLTWILNTSADPMPPDEVAEARDQLGMSGQEFAEAIGAAHRQHTYRAEREKGLRGCQAKIVRLLLDARPTQ